MNDERRASPAILDGSTDDEVFLSARGVIPSSDEHSQDYRHSIDHPPVTVAAVELHSSRKSPSTEFDHYPLNEDLTPEHIRRANPDRIQYRQDVAIRYLQPPTPPPSGPVIIREIRAPQLAEAPPLVIYQRPPHPTTPPPIVIRERPPVPPAIEPPRVVNKYLPAPPPPARKVIIERQAPLPAKPQPIIIEKWLPYRPAAERRVVVEHAPPLMPRAPPTNTVITFDAPRIDLVKNVRELGTVRVDPHMYAAQYGSQLASADYVLSTMNRFGLGNNYAQLAHTSHPSGYREEYTTLPDGRRHFHSRGSISHA